MKEIDFVKCNLKDLTKIMLPLTQQKQSKPESHSRFRIQKSFKPQKQQTMDETIRIQLEQLKKHLKKKQNQQRKQRILRDELKQAKETTQQTKPTQQIQKIIIDESGQVRDEHGNLLYVKNRTTDFMINQKKEQQIQLKQLQQKRKIKFHKKLGRNLLDRNLLVGSMKKRVRRSLLGLRFLEKGSYQVKQVVKNQVKEQVSNLEDAINQPIFTTIKKRNKAILKFDRDIPQIQWWDKNIIKINAYEEIYQHLDQIQQFILIENITNQVRYQKVGDGNKVQQKVILPTYLTKEEKKKLKRKKKHEKLLQKNDKIKLGIIESQKPKLRVGNMAIVLKNEFILDPSKVQAQARKQTQQRLNRHLQSNEDRKLTKKQKKQKRIRKKMRDSAKQVHRAVFRLNKLDNPSECFKVSVNATHNFLSGFTIKPAVPGTQPVIIVVQGGARDVKDYQKLLLKRIKWSQNDPLNHCKLLWEGTIPERSSGKWRIFQVDDQVETIRILTEKKIEHYYDLLINE